MDLHNVKLNKRKSLTIIQKMEILNKLENGVKNFKLCTEFNVSSSTISTILKNKEQIKRFYTNLKTVDRNSIRKRVTAPEYEVLETTVYAWLCQKRTIGEPVSGQILQAKAIFFHEKLKLNGQVPKNKEEFKCSDGWLANFKKRYGLRTLQLKGEKASADTEASDIFCEDFSKFITDGGYDLDNVYNCDETGIEYRSLPDKTLVLADEEEVSGRKPIKDRLTLMVCANSSGTHSIPLLVIGKSKNPRCFKNKSIPLEYANQTKAWMNSELFLHWFKNIFLESVRKLKPEARIVLLLDNAPSHPKADILNAVDKNCFIIYLPPNVTSLIQPMDQGVISSLKRRYKMSFLRELLAHNHNTHDDFVQFVKKWSVLDCMYVLKEVWNLTTPNTLRNSWKKLIPNLLSDSSSEASTNSEIANLLNRIPGESICSTEDVVNWIEEEQNLPVFEIMSDDQLLNLHAGLQLPELEKEDSIIEEQEELDEFIEPSTSDSILKAAQCIVDWTRQRDEFTDEERMTLLRVRDVVLDLLQKQS